MKDFDKIDDFLKHKVGSSHFAVDEAHWEDALKRLNPEEDKKRPWIWILSLLLVVGVSTISAGIYFNEKGVESNNTTNISNVSNAATAQYAVKNNQDENIISNAQTIAEDQTVTNNSGNINGHTNTIRNASITTATPQPIYASNNKSNNAKNANARNKQDLINKIKNSNTTGITSTNINSKKQKSNKKAKQGVAAAKSTNTPKQPTGNKRLKNKDILLASAMASPNGANSLTNLDNRNIANRNNIASPQKQAKPRIYKSVAEMQAMNPRYVAGLENYDYEVTDIKLNSTASADVRARAAAKAQATQAADKPINIVSASQVERDFNSLFLIAGVSAAKGYKGNIVDKSVYGLSPNLGIGYQLAVRNNVNLYFSLFASYINHLNISETSKSTTYSFDKVVKQTEVARKNLIQIHLPVTVGYRFNERHTLLGGIGLSYGANTLSNINTNEEVVTSFGYMRGLRSIDANVHAGYEYKINDAIRLNLMYQEGLFDITNNNYFNNNIVDRNRRISIGVRYNFGKR